MKAVIQRVSKATVTNIHKDKVVGEIKHGMFVLIGIKKGDTEENVIKLVAKLKKLRIFEEVEGKMSHSALDLHLPVLVVSQFTLLADTSGGNRPSFLDAEEPARAKKLYELFIEELRVDLIVETGSFGEYMKINTELDGPVTIVMEI